MPQRFKDAWKSVLQQLNAASSSGVWVLAMFVIVSLTFSNVAGPKLAWLGLAPMALASIIAGPATLVVMGRGGLKALRTVAKTPRFWVLVILTALVTAGVTLPFSKVANTLPLGILTPIMGTGPLVLTLIEVLPGSRGIRRFLALFSPLLTVAGFVIFKTMPTPGAGPISLNDLGLAALAALSLTAFILLQGMAAKLGQNTQKPQSRGQDAKPGLLVMAFANPLAGICLLIWVSFHPEGHPITHWLGLGLLLQITFWGLLWMTIPTGLNMVARAGLPKGTYPALQQLGSPIGMLIQIWVQHKPASAAAWAANLLIFTGSVLVTLDDVGNPRLAWVRYRARRDRYKAVRLQASLVVAKAEGARNLAKVEARNNETVTRLENDLRKAEVAAEAAEALARTVEIGINEVAGKTGELEAARHHAAGILTAAKTNRAKRTKRGANN